MNVYTDRNEQRTIIVQTIENSLCIDWQEGDKHALMSLTLTPARISRLFEALRAMKFPYYRVGAWRHFERIGLTHSEHLFGSWNRDEAVEYAARFAVDTFVGYVSSREGDTLYFRGDTEDECVYVAEELASYERHGYPCGM